MHTPHGVVDTPGFVAVGTNAALKFVNHRDADAAGLQLMFANTFHLLVHPGPDVVAAAGGLHKFMGRDRPIITDSGGFQVARRRTSLAYGLGLSLGLSSCACCWTRHHFFGLLLQALLIAH